MKKLVIFFICLNILLTPVMAFDLDMTVDDEIRKNYNSSKLVKDTKTEDSEPLPNLPEILKKESSKPATSKPIQIKPLAKINKVKITRGSVLDVTNTTKINDWQTKGTTVKFTNNQVIAKHGFVIPQGTIFTGEIIESHQPQISCNGGLVVVRIRSINIQGHTAPLNAYVTLANSKHIFLNNIKGERTYLKTTYKKGNWGRALFNKMLTLTINLGKDTPTLLLSPFPFAYGTICLGLNTLVSPISAFFNKGGHVSIPAGSKFKIRVMDETIVE